MANFALSQRNDFANIRLFRVKWASHSRQLRFDRSTYEVLIVLLGNSRNLYFSNVTISKSSTNTATLVTLISKMDIENMDQRYPIA